MLNLIPILTESRPTSHVEVGESKVGPSTDVVAVEHNTRRAYFYARTVDDRVVDDIGNKARMHENVAALFGGIDRSGDFLVDPDARPGEVHACESATVYAAGADEDRLAAFLRENGYLLHPIEEVVSSEDGLVSFDVVEMAPTGYTTLRVTDETDLEFVDAGEYRERKSRQPDRAGRGGTAGAAVPGGPGGGQGIADEEEAVQVTLDPKKPTKSFAEDVAGLDEVKRTAETLLALFDPETREAVATRYGEGFAARGNSMLLYGPPGCGKTLVAEAIAHEAKYNSDIEGSYGEVKFLEVKGSDVLSKYSGESEKKVEAIFERAHGVAQEGFAVLFFDEVETLVPDRGDDSLQRHERSLTNAFLQEMNDVEDNLLVVGATNMPFTIDPAATRRFPIQQFIPQPDADVMAEVWRKHLDGLSTADAVEFDELGEASVGYTPAEIADRVLGSELQREFVEGVVAGDPVEVDTDYLLEKLDGTEPKTVRQYVASVRQQVEDLEGYPEMRRYVEAQADRLGISLHGGGPLEQLLAAGSAGSGSGGEDDAGDGPGEGGETPAAGGDADPPAGTGDAEEGPQ